MNEESEINGTNTANEVNKQEGYVKEKRIIDIVAASKWALAIIGFSVVLLGVPFYLIWKPVLVITWQGALLFSLLFIAGVAMHELIHGIFFGLFAESGFSSVRFGFTREYLTPYCHCNEPLKVKHYSLAALMPALLLGLLPMVVAFFVGSLFWLLFGIVFLSAAAGDLMVVWILRKETSETLVHDHVSEPGCWVYKKSLNQE
jgi:fatty acid desaturase